MPIEETCREVAKEVMCHDFVEIFCHHDADGIAAGSILATALLRADKRFRLRVKSRIKSADLPENKHILLCDLGSGIEDLPEDTMVVDHHMPLFEGSYHVNPRLAGIDGDLELSAAGAAYLLAQALGDNRDLAGLVMPGIIGDRQTLSGKNYEIYSEAIANSIISPLRGLRLGGRDTAEKVLLASVPYLDNLSGIKEQTDKIIAECQDEEGKIDQVLLNSLLVLAGAEKSSSDALTGMYGDIYRLEREVCEDAHSMTMLIDSCGKAGEGSLAASICLRSTSELEKAWDVAKSHRLKVIEGLAGFSSHEQTGEIICFEAADKTVSSDLADAVLDLRMPEVPVMVFARSEKACNISLRCSGNQHNKNLGEIVHAIADECGGSGGGHRTRAGATISCEHIDRFRAEIEGALAG